MRAYTDPGDRNVDRPVQDSDDPRQMRLFSAPSAPKPGTQNHKVLAYIRTHGSISDLEAYRELGIRRLAARIYDLKAMGYTFTVEDEKHEGGAHARYREE